MAWQEHNTFDVLEEEDETFLEDLVCYQFRISNIQGRHSSGVHYEAWSEVPVTAVDIEGARLQKSHAFFGYGAANWQGRKPLQMIDHFHGTFLLVKVVCLNEFEHIPFIELIGNHKVLFFK